MFLFTGDIRLLLGFGREFGKSFVWNALVGLRREGVLETVLGRFRFRSPALRPYSLLFTGNVTTGLLISSSSWKSQTVLGSRGAVQLLPSFVFSSGPERRLNALLYVVTRLLPARPVLFLVVAMFVPRQVDGARVQSQW